MKTTLIPLAISCLSILGPSLLAGPLFESKVIDAEIDIGYGIALEDMDGDGDKDVILADKNDFVWYENPSWLKHLLAHKVTERDHVCLAARDLDADGRAEIAVGAGWNPGNTIDSGSVHYLNRPAGQDSVWGLEALPYEPTVHRMHWLRDSLGDYFLVVVPLHGRSNVGGRGDGVRTLGYRFPESVRGPWTTELISNSLHLSHNADPVQWDADGAEELLIAGSEGVMLCDYRNGTWREQKLIGKDKGHADFVGAGEVRYGELDQQLSLIATVEPLHGNQAVVYTSNDRFNSERVWSRHVLTDSLRHGHALACGDFLGQGFDQVVVGWRMPDESGKVGIRLYWNPDGQGEAWRSTFIDDNEMACEDLRAADMDGDGKLDIVAAGRATKNLKLYLNRSSL